MDHVIEYQAQCRCGWKSEPQRDLKTAEVLGDVHEGFRVVRPYAHDTQIEEVSK